MPTVLIVEDERDIRDLLRRYLERAGFVDLTPTEWGLLATVVTAPGRVYSRYERTINSHNPS